MSHRLNTHGAALVVTMIFIFIAVFAVGGYLFVITKDSNMAKKMNDSIKALYLAEAGLERAVSDLKDLGIWPVAGTVLYSNTPLGEGTFSVKVQNLINNNRIRLRADGFVREEARIITAYVSRPTTFDWGIFSDEKIELEDSTVDSYNSTEGPYGGDNVYQNGDMGTNAIGTNAVKMEDSTVNGDVVIGQGGDVATDINLENSTITGETSTLDESVDLPSFSPPGGLPGRGELHLQNSTATISASGQYDLIKLEGSSTLTIDTGGGTIVIYITGEFKLENTSGIDIIGGDVDIYIADKFKMEDNTSINSNIQNPGLLTVYGTPTLSEVKLEDNAEFFGAIYVPNTEFIMEDNAVLYGSVVANKVELEGASLHYDEALAGTGPGTGGLLIVDRWQEKEEEELD